MRTAGPWAIRAAGLGCRRGTGADAVLALLAAACARLGWDGVPDDLILATVAAKADEPGLRAAAARLDRPLIVPSAAALAAALPLTTTASPAALAALGLPSVAETAALAACGAGGRLLLPRLAAATCTCAIACGGETAP